MNRVTVQQTTQGLVQYLQQEYTQERLQHHGVLIGYDGRHGSLDFARIAAAVCASKGLRVHLFSTLVPTPFVASGVQMLGCAAGVMVTASHNPKHDNGYKVYWGNGCQIIPPHDSGIAAAIDANLDLWELPPTALQDPYSNSLVSDPLEEVSGRYYSRLAAALHYRPKAANAAAPPMVYTALHGVGTPWVQQAFDCFGLPPPLLTKEQCTPDPDFPTVAFPNPEEGRGAWELAFRAAEQAGAKLAFATDPDADRYAVAEFGTEGGGWRTFNGNEIGAMLAHWVLTQHRHRVGQEGGVLRKQRGVASDEWGVRQPGSGGAGEEGAESAAPSEQLAMLSSAVSSRMLESMAEQEGVRWRETLTGFKWLGNQALQMEAQGYTVLFAFEEAIGFMFGQVGKDKDGVAASAVFAELAADVYSRGATLTQHWQQLQRQYGVYEYRSGYFLAHPPSRSRAVFESLRAAYPTTIGGQRVLAVRDLGTGVDTGQPGGVAILPWQPGDLMITFTLEGPATLTLRASGTEPKLKYYLEASAKGSSSAGSAAGVGPDSVADGLKESWGNSSDAASVGAAAAAQLAARLERAVGEELVRPQVFGLTVPAVQ